MSGLSILNMVECQLDDPKLGSSPRLLHQPGDDHVKQVHVVIHRNYHSTIQEVAGKVGMNRA